MASEKGFEIFSKGYPDYIIKKGKKIIFVECKREQKKTQKMGFSRHQIQIKKIFQELGLNYKIFRGNWEGIEDIEYI